MTDAAIGEVVARLTQEGIHVTATREGNSVHVLTPFHGHAKLST